VPYSQRDIDHDRHSREGLMVYVADVIETQLRNLDEAKKAKREADQRVSAPPDVSAPAPVPAHPRPMLEGDRRREEIRARNQEAVQRFDAKMKERVH
jgi:hypothetical protein